MTKSTKHKKEVRKEKQKIKLKLTARANKPRIGKNKKTTFLPKGLNVTDTSFKSRKIVLPENLRLTEDSTTPQSYKRQTFKELVSHMGHFNSTVQQDGITGMKELLTRYPETLETNLAALLGKLSELVAAQESAVRRAALKLFEHVLHMVPQEQVLPFFPLLNAQLLCSMNHISLEIQKDSHALLDVLLTHVPRLVSTVVMQILPNFLEQISCRDDSKAGKRILAINPNQRLTSLKWRQEVLVRIHRLLLLLLEQKRLMGTHNSEKSATVYNPRHSTAPLYTKRDFRIKLSLQQLGQVTVNDSTSPANQLQGFVGHLFPLLTETWIEAMASEQLNKNQEDSLIGTESIALLVCITNVIYTLWEILNLSDARAELHRWFESEFGEPIIRHFIRHFPFTPRVQSNRGNKSKSDTSCREQNLVLCFIWTQFQMKSAAKYANTIFKYLTDVFQSADRQPLTPNEMDHLKHTLLANCSKKHLLVHVNSVVEAATEFGTRVRSDRKDRLLLNRVLMDIGMCVEELGSIPALRNWIESCPALINQDNNEPLLGSINCVMSRNAMSLASGKSHLPHFLSRLDRSHAKYDWKAVFDFIYWTRGEWNDEQSECKDILQRQIDRLDDPVLKAYGQGVIGLMIPS